MNKKLVEVSTENMKEETKKMSKLAIGIIILIPIASLFLVPWLTKMFYPKMAEAGQFGDMFGSLNALASIGAIIGLIVTIRQQKDELSLQRQELRLTREEMQNQREEMEMQRKEMKVQADVAKKQTKINLLSAKMKGKLDAIDVGQNIINLVIKDQWDKYQLRSNFGQKKLCREHWERYNNTAQAFLTLKESDINKVDDIAVQEHLKKYNRNVCDFNRLEKELEELS